jgi:hypothetical protein
MSAELESKALETLKFELADLPEDEDELIEPVEEICELKRIPRAKADACAICSEEGDTTPNKELVLQIELTEFYICLCPKHEGLLLQRLLNNYVKRITKHSKAGFIAGIPKEALVNGT